MTENEITLYYREIINDILVNTNDHDERLDLMFDSIIHNHTLKSLKISELKDLNTYYILLKNACNISKCIH